MKMRRLPFLATAFCSTQMMTKLHLLLLMCMQSRALKKRTLEQIALMLNDLQRKSQQMRCRIKFYPRMNFAYRFDDTPL